MARKPETTDAPARAFGSIALALRARPLTAPFAPTWLLRKVPKQPADRAPHTKDSTK